MTTHYQKIQALGNRMAENLTIMGVPSQFEEGGLTLADKILEISGRVTSGIILYADKKIAQSEDTVNLSMMVLEDGVFKTGVDVYLHDVEIFNHTYSSGASINEPIGDDWILETTGIVGIRSYEDERTLMMCGGGVVNIMVDGTTVYTNTSVSTTQFTYKDGVFSFDDETVDLSSYTQRFNFLDNIGYDGGSVSVVGPAVCTTDSHGLATYAYTCTGSGLKEFYATSGTFVSETYSILDAKFYDTAILNGSHNNDTYYKSNSNYERFSDGTLITATGSSNGYLMIDETGDTKPFNEELCFECDIVTSSSNNNGFFVVGTNNTLIKTNSTTTGYHVKLEVKTTGILLTIDDNTPVPYNAVTGNYDIRFIVATGNTLKFKNAVLYPI